MATKTRRVWTWLTTEVKTIKHDFTGLPHPSEIGLFYVKTGWFFLGVSVALAIRDREIIIEAIAQNPWLFLLNIWPTLAVIGVFMITSYYWRRRVFPERRQEPRNK